MSSPSPPDDAEDRVSGSSMRRLDQTELIHHLESLNRVARSLCRSRDNADDLVQETLARVLGRPRRLRGTSDRSYLLRALHNTHVDQHRAALRRVATVPLCDEDSVQRSPLPFTATELMSAIAGAPQPYREAVLAVDVVGLSYQQAARYLHTCVATTSTRLFRGRQLVAGALGDSGGPRPQGA